MLTIALISIMIGIIICFIKQHLIKEGKLQEKDRIIKFFDIPLYTLLSLALLIYTYTITDTWKEWGIITILYGTVIVISLFLGKLIGRLSKHKLIITFFILPIIGFIYCIISCYIITLSISKDANAIMTGMIVCLFSVIDNATKENKAFRRSMLIEIVILFVVFSVGEQQDIKTKPMRILYNQLGDIPANCTEIKVYEDMDSPQRGRKALLKVFFETENDVLLEIRYYTYLAGKVEIESVYQYE